MWGLTWYAMTRLYLLRQLHGPEKCATYESLGRLYAGEWLYYILQFVEVVKILFGYTCSLIMNASIAFKALASLRVSENGMCYYYATLIVTGCVLLVGQVRDV